MESSAGGRKRLRRPLLGRSLSLSPSAMLTSANLPGDRPAAAAGGELLFTSTQSRAQDPPALARGEDHAPVTRTLLVTRTSVGDESDLCHEERVTRNPVIGTLAGLVQEEPSGPRGTLCHEEPCVTRNPDGNPEGPLCHEEPVRGTAV
ncbi:unnamed protein product [Arctogadus glacialis]